MRNRAAIATVWGGVPALESKRGPDRRSCAECSESRLLRDNRQNSVIRDPLSEIFLIPFIRVARPERRWPARDGLLCPARRVILSGELVGIGTLTGGFANPAK